LRVKIGFDHQLQNPSHPELNLYNNMKNKQFIIPSMPGLVESPSDKRDILTSDIIPPIQRYPKECPAPFDLDILHQGLTPECVSHGGSSLKQYLEKRERSDVIFDEDSAHWLHKKCKEIDNYDGPGTYLRVMLKVLMKDGLKPKGGTEADAAKYRISGYAKVDDLSFESLKKHIFVYGMVLAGFRGSNPGWKTAYIRPPKAGEKTWGHAVDLIAYIIEYLKGQNSWGPGWGDKGHFYDPESYKPFEAWVVLLDSPNEGIQNTKEGWVALPYVNTAQTGNRAVVITPVLNLRDNPNGNLIGKLKQGQKLEIIEKPQSSGNYTWVKVRPGI